MGWWLSLGSCPPAVAAHTGQEECSLASGDKDVFMAELFCSFY